MVMIPQFSSRIKIFISICILIINLEATAQQELSIHFIKGLIQNTEANPANISSDKFVLSLPSVYGNYNNSAFALKDLGKIENSTLFLAPQKALEKLKSNNNLIQSNVNLSLGSLAFRFKNSQLRLFHNSNLDFYGYYPEKMMELLWYGNEPFIGENIEIAPKIDIFAYHEYGLGFAIQVNEKISVGTNIKYLSGMVNVNSQRMQASLFTNNDNYQLSAQTDMNIYSSGLSAFLEDSSDDLIINDDNSDWFLTQNSGLALDFGLNFQLTDQVKLTGSVLDLGFINWRENTIEQVSKGDFVFDGIEVKPFDDSDDFEFYTVIDSIGSLVDFESKTLNNGYKTQLPFRYYVSGIWDIDSTFSLGALTYGEYYRNKFSPAFAVNAQKSFRHFLEVGSTIAINHNRSPNIGFNLTLRLAGIQIYGITDNVIPLINISNGRNFNVRFGLNVAIKGKQVDEEINDDLIAESLDNSVEEEAITETSKKSKKKKKDTNAVVKISKKKEYFRRTDKY
jgi:hypothetical protein